MHTNQAVSHGAKDGAPVQFVDKVVLITGGGAGFGRAMASAFYDEGASVVVLDRDGTTAAETSRALDQNGGRVLAVECDVSDSSQFRAAVAAATELFGGVDILINNAGLHLSKYNQPFSQLGESDLRSLFDVNVMGVINGSLACEPAMSARGGGVMINIASMASYSSTTPYGVSKLAVRGLTIAFAKEFAPSKIRCNAVSPGLISTEAAMADLPDGLVDEIVNARQLIPRLGEVDDIVQTIMFLCSDKASFITGETLKVSGGTPLWI